LEAEKELAVAPEASIPGTAIVSATSKCPMSNPFLTPTAWGVRGDLKDG
jgi:hypothetical protein